MLYIEDTILPNILADIDSDIHKLTNPVAPSLDTPASNGKSKGFGRLQQRAKRLIETKQQRKNPELQVPSHLFSEKIIDAMYKLFVFVVSFVLWGFYMWYL